MILIGIVFKQSISICLSTVAVPDHDVDQTVIVEITRGEASGILGIIQIHRADGAKSSIFVIAKQNISAHGLDKNEIQESIIIKISKRSRFTVRCSGDSHVHFYKLRISRCVISNVFEER